MLDVQMIYDGSNGYQTRALYAHLETLGPAGLVALNLFRAQKCSARAKRYRGGLRGLGSFKDAAYSRKEWSIQNLCRILSEHAAALGIGWGWGRDPAQPVHCWVLYCDLPTGQVSFHAAKRGGGPDYPGRWDGQHASATRIIGWCRELLEGAAKESSMTLDSFVGEA